MPTQEASFKQKVIKGFLWLGTGTFLGQFISWCSTIIVIRLLAPSDYGLMAMGLTFINLLLMISELGVGAAIIQAPQINEKEIHQIFGLVIICSVFGWMLSYISAPLIAQFFNEDKVISLLRVLGINFFLIALFIIPQSFLVREMNFKIKAKVDVSAQIGASILTLILAVKGMGVWSLIFGLVFLHMIKAVAYNYYRFSIIKPDFNFKKAGNLIKFGLTVTGDRLLYYVFMESDKIVGGRFLGEALLGLYSVALNLASIPAEKVLPIITQVTFTSYSRIQHDMDRIKRNLLRTTRVIALVGFPLFLGMAAIAPEAIPLLLGSKWESIVVPFQLICLILPFKALGPIFPPAIFAVGKPRVNLINMAITSTIMTLAFLVGVKWGLMGLCFAWVFAYPIVFLITMMRGLRALQLPLRHVLSEIAFPLIAGLAMVFVLFLLRKMGPTIQPLLFLTISVFLGAILYTGLLMTFKKEAYLELKNTLRK